MPNQPIELTDDFHRDTPLAFLVPNDEDTLYEYETFVDLDAAKARARREQHDHGGDWQIYPLYAGEPLYLSDDEKLKGWE